MESFHKKSLKRSIERLQDMIDARNKPEDKKEINYWFTPRAYAYLDECCRLSFIGDSELYKIVGNPADAISVYKNAFQEHYPDCSFQFKLINDKEHDYIVNVKW